MKPLIFLLLPSSSSFFFHSRVDFNSNELYIRELTFDSPKQKVEFPKRGKSLNSIYVFSQGSVAQTQTVQRPKMNRVQFEDGLAVLDRLFIISLGIVKYGATGSKLQQNPALPRAVSSANPKRGEHRLPPAKLAIA